MSLSIEKKTNPKKHHTKKPSIGFFPLVLKFNFSFHLYGGLFKAEFWLFFNL